MTNMSRVNIMYELEPEFLTESQEEYFEKKPKHIKNIDIKIDDKTFELLKKEGLIQKTDHGYVFIGKRKDLKEVIKNK